MYLVAESVLSISMKMEKELFMSIDAQKLQRRRPSFVVFAYWEMKTVECFVPKGRSIVR